MATPAVSVVIPLYNKEKTIFRSIESVLDQTFGHFEVIVVDDGSIDRSAAIVEEIRDPRVILVGQPNAGPGTARNNGAHLARARYIAFLDADDEWRAGYLAAAVKALEVNPDCAAYVCGYDSGNFRAERPNKLLALVESKGPRSPPVTSQGRDMKLWVDALHSSAVMVRRDEFHRLGGFYADNGCRYGEDSWLYARLLFSKPIFWDPEEHLRFHVEDSDLGYAVRQRKMARPISLYPDKLGKDLDDPARCALRRLSAVYAKADYNLLTASGSWSAASGLRRKFKIGGVLGAVTELARRAKFHAKLMWSD